MWKEIHFPLLYKTLTFSSLKSHLPLCLFPSPCYSDMKPNIPKELSFTRRWLFPFAPPLYQGYKYLCIHRNLFFFFWKSVSLSKWDSLSGLDHVFLLKKNYYLFFLATLGLSCCTQSFSSCSEWGLLCSYGVQALIAVASLTVEHRF